MILKENEFNSQIINSNMNMSQQHNRSFALSTKPTRLNETRQNNNYGIQNEYNHSKVSSPNRSMVQDDEQIRKKISDQINFVKCF